MAEPPNEPREPHLTKSSAIWPWLLLFAGAAVLVVGIALVLSKNGRDDAAGAAPSPVASLAAGDAETARTAFAQDPHLNCTTALSMWTLGIEQDYMNVAGPHRRTWTDLYEQWGTDSQLVVAVRAELSALDQRLSYETFDASWSETQSEIDVMCSGTSLETYVTQHLVDSIPG